MHLRRIIAKAQLKPVRYAAFPFLKKAIYFLFQYWRHSTAIGVSLSINFVSPWILVILALISSTCLRL